LGFCEGGADMAKNKFRGPDYEEHSFEDQDGNLIGKIRVKPSGILWKKADGKKYYRVTLDKFIEWILEKGETVEQ
jgi:hypothetical protein